MNEYFQQKTNMSSYDDAPLRI